MKKAPTDGEERMIEKGLVLTDNNAKSLSNAFAEVKTKSFEESEARVDATQALDVHFAVQTYGERRTEERKTPRVS